jgi:hypothetical protein
VAGQSAQCSGSSCERLRHDLRNVARLEEPVLDGVAAGMPFQTFNKDHRRYTGGPKTLVTQRHDQSERLLRTLCETAETSRIEDQHRA